MAVSIRHGALPYSEAEHRSRCRRSAAELDTAQFAAALREQRRFRVEQLAELADADTRGTDLFGSLEVKVAVQRAAAHALAEIEAALARLDEGSYGTCTGCGRQISGDRLEVLPAAALCMACQHRAHNQQPPLPARAGAAGRST
jgi:DnaK suppressor protein